MRKLRKFLAAASLLFVSLLISTPSGYSQTSYTWSSVGSMVQARSGAAAVSLPGGKVLITGGADSDGVPATASEIFDPGSGGFATAAPMNVPRANHSAILLATGDVLVTGGVTTGGGYSDTAEIFSAQAGVWTVLEASLGTGLAKHAMATLSDGNVLIAGGQSTAGPVGSLLLFNVSDRSFTAIGNLMVARTGAVAAATPDGRVLVAGGTDINGVVLSSTEVFTYAADTMTGTVTAGPTMTYPRTNATATTTYDGVAVIGGNSGNADLGSAEIFSQWTNAFRLVGGATPRSGHIAIFLPQNGSILAMGGSGGTTVDLLQPWGNNIAGAFLTSMPSSLDHTGGFVAPATIGTMLAGGGTGSSANAAEVYWFPTISTDQPDYAPGTPVVMNGMGFKPGENVKLYMREWVNQMLVDPPDYTVTTDANGSFRFMEYAPTISDLGARYHLTVTGATSGLQAQVVFTDNYPKTNLTIAVNPAGGSPTANSVVAGSTSGASDYIFTCTTAGGCTNTATNINNNANAFITATAGTGRLFSSWSVSGDAGGTGTTCVTGYTGNPCILNAGTSSRTTKVTANFSLTTSLAPTLVAADKVYDGTAAEPNDSMSCTLSGVHTGDNVTCTATNGSFATANAGSGNTVTATVTLGGPDAAKYTFGAAGTVVSSEPATASATIKQATATISVTPYSVAYDGAAHTATGTATGIGSANLNAGFSLGGTTHTNAGTYSDTWTFQDAAGNYANATGNVTDVIKQAKAAISVTPYTTTYDGISHTATGTATGINSVVISGLVLTGTTHTNAGTYSADGWSFHDGSGNYADDSGTVNDVIDKASATVSVTPYTVTYSGTSHTATASISGVHGETDAAVGTVDLSHTSHMNASVYAADYWTFTGASNYKDIGNTIITDTINKADATVTITPYTVTYDGQAHTAAIASITGVAGETGATVGWWT